MIAESKQQVAVAVNATMSNLYWIISKHVQSDFLKHSRTDYGATVVKSLAKQLTERYGKGWSEKQLRHCMRFAETFPEEAIVSTLWRPVSWSHLNLVIYIADPLKKRLLHSNVQVGKMKRASFSRTYAVYAV